MNLITFFVAILASFSSAAPPPLTFRNDVSLPLIERDSSPAVPMLKRGIQECNSKQIRTITQYLDFSGHLADLVAVEATMPEGAEKFKEFFKTSDKNHKREVAKIFEKIAVEFKKKGKGEITFNCYSGMTPEYPEAECTGRNFMYSSKSTSNIVLCNKWFDMDYTSKCHHHNAISVLIAETTKLHEFGATFDYKSPRYDGLQYDGLLQLPKEKNLAHSSSYGLFAQAIDWEHRNKGKKC